MMRGFKGWALGLDGVIISGGCEHGQQEWDDSACGVAEQIVIDRLTAPPEGLSAPDQRISDVTFTGRDGVKHYDDYYGPRPITALATIGPNECKECRPVRKQFRDLAQAWRRKCQTGCDEELVIYTPCSGDVYDEFPTPELVTERVNYFANNSRGTDYTNHCNTFEFTDTRGFADGTGTYSLFEETLDLPANLPTPQDVVRKTWTGGMIRYVSCYDDTPDHVCYPECYDAEEAGSNNGGGFIMGCTGQSAFAVTENDVWTLSGYLRSSASGWNLLLRVFFYDQSGASIATSEGSVTVSVADTWHRLSHTVTVPVGAVTMQYVLDTADGGTPIAPGDTLDAAAGMAEKSDTLGVYFDGDFLDTDDPVLGGQKIEYDWDGSDFGSASVERSYIYVAGPDRELNGPFGAIGRPRVAQGRWRTSKRQVADWLFRFDAVDHRLYILDACGTPGYAECEVVQPGSFIKASCYGLTGVCYPECYDQDVAGSQSVTPTAITVIGTETTYPTITLNPSLTNPRVEDLTTGKAITFRGTINEGDLPVIIYTEDGTAFQGDVSVSHLLGGTLDFSLEPGDHEIRLLSQSLADTGTVQVCWRPAVIAA